MARPLRIQAPGLTYHVTSRGNAQMSIYVDDEDRHAFLELLSEVVLKHEVRVRTYSEMTNHYHLVCLTTLPNISSAMRDLNGGYAQYFNRRHHRSGHLYQGRFNAQIVEEAGYLREVCRYVALNPVRAGLVSRPELWPWSAHRALAGMDPEPAFLASDFMRLEFLEQDLGAARSRYIEFVESRLDTTDSGDSDTFEGGKRIVGSPEFVARFEESLRTASREVPRRERLLARPSLDAVLEGTPARTHLNARLLKAHDVHGYTLVEMATFLGLSRRAVSVRLSEARRSALQST